ncbi:Transcriptional activator protein acu-15 [Grifola frondosa]|uniref:Transcriptional activator protein acu-15 n=1 Tax=Grifola frondosa TaxID=5627 RepID=A0A1C7MIN7_GRIFR|nr:Transcriptional activator protein acu-15 [Grifola frondosa]
MMGLSMDPDEFPGTYSLFEAETRRRVWWDVFYYDLFISDCMGHPPLIADNSFTTRFPADVDEHLFTPSSTSLPYTHQGADWSETSTAYFVLKCRLAQLVKNVKKQTFKDPLGDDSADLSVDLAATFETEVSSFLQDLPPPFRLEMDQDISTVVPPPSCSPFLLAQRCELAILANRLILKLYLPFLKDTTGGTQPNRPSHQAVLGTINAAHLVIYASRLLHAVWRHTRPAAFDFYDFGRTLFDAAVVCAHAVIQQPTSILAAEAMKCVGCALDIMKELGAVRTGVEGIRGDNNRAEAIKVVEMMKRKAEAARVALSLRLPFVGASVTSSKTELPKPVGSSSSKASTTLSKDVDVVAITKPEPKKLATKEKEKSKEKARYPAVGIRVRPAQMATPTSRQRTGSVSVAATPVTPVSSARTVPLPPPTPCAVSIPVSSSLGQPDTPRTAISASPSVPPSVSTYDNMQPQDAYPVRYPASDDLLGERRFSSHSTPSYDSPQSVMYEQSARYHSAQQSPASYTAPGPPDYYMSYASSSGPSPTYENPGLVPSQNLSMMPSAPAMETVGAPPMTGLCHDPYATHDKSHNSYPSHISEPRQMTQDYQPPPTGHPMSMSTPHIQGWPQTDPGSTGDMQWTDYKFFDGMTG